MWLFAPVGCLLGIVTFSLSDSNLVRLANWNKCFEGKTLATLRYISFKQCHLQCQYRRPCQAANYWMRKQRCKLIFTDGVTPLQLVTEENCVSIERANLPEIQACSSCGDESVCDPANNDCVIRECQSITVHGGNVEGNLVYVGARVKIECNFDYDLHPMDARPQCKADGNWDVQPHCACENSVALVTGPDGISDSHISASSEYTTDFLSRFVRLDSNAAWAAEHDDLDEYIQFNFTTNRTVEEILTQGSGYEGYPEWVTSYKIHYSMDCENFAEYDQVLLGNNDTDTLVSNVIHPPIFARCVRVNPLTWYTWNSMRIELMGC